MATDDLTRDPWRRGDCEEGPPPGYAEREAARKAAALSSTTHREKD